MKQSHGRSALRIGAAAFALCVMLAGCSTVQSLLDGPSDAPEPPPVQVPPAPLQAPTAPAPSAPQQASVPPPVPATPTPAAPPPAAPSSTAPPAASTAPIPAAPAAAASPTADKGNTDVLSEDEALAFYQDVMLTYAFDACGLPLLGVVSRQDIAHRLEVCPAPADRKEALRVVLQRAVADAERDPAKTRAGALALCADKRAFLRNVMRHANELTFDDNAPPNCTLISPPAAPLHP